MDERIRKQLAFALEIDKEKIFSDRLTCLVMADGKRCEHAWHMAIMAYLFREYANEEVNITKVMLMCLIHDIVEIEAGDTYAYDEEGLKSQKEREERAKEKLYYFCLMIRRGNWLACLMSLNPTKARKHVLLMPWITCSR